VCCNISGSFPAYLAVLQNSCGLAILYIAIENILIIRVLLQKEEVDPYDFTFETFRFHFLNSSVDDICKYEVTRGNYSFQLLVLGIDTSKLCDTNANVDFFHFLWQNVNQYGYRRHSMTVSPPIFPDGPPRPSFLRHYLAAASGWEYTSRCVACREQY
jgi:hypothetical protein